MNYETILNQKIQGIQPSGIRKFFDILEEMKDAISLGIGEPDFVTPWHIRDAGIYSLERGYTKYTSNAGMAELRREIASYLDRRFGLKYDYASQILVTVGGSEALDLSLRVLLNPGDEVIIPVPSFVCYGPLTEMAGGVPVYVELKAENQFRLTPEQLKAAITPRTKALVLPFPSNPTGGIMERQDLEALAQVLRDTEIMVVSDEIYAELTYGQRHVSMANLEEMYDRTIVVNGFSKSHAMTGWRMGYVCAPSLFQLVVARCAGQTADMAVYRRNRDLFLDALRSMGYTCAQPEGAFYLFPRSLEPDAAAFCERARKYDLILVSGDSFGCPGHVRISYCVPTEQIQRALPKFRALAREYGVGG